MQEYNDGTFGEIQEGSDLLKKLADDPIEMARTKAIHFGAEGQQSEIQFWKDLYQQQVELPGIKRDEDRREAECLKFLNHVREVFKSK